MPVLDCQRRAAPLTRYWDVRACSSVSRRSRQQTRPGGHPEEPSSSPAVLISRLMRGANYEVLYTHRVGSKPAPLRHHTIIKCGKGAASTSQARGRAAGPAQPSARSCVLECLPYSFVSTCVPHWSASFIKRAGVLRGHVAASRPARTQFRSGSQYKRAVALRPFSLSSL